MSRCIRHAYPAFYGELVRVSEELEAPLRIRQRPHSFEQNFRWAQDVANLLVHFSVGSDSWLSAPTVATGNRSIQVLRTNIRRGNAKGLIFFKNCFRRRTAGDGPPAELAGLDGQGDHIDLHVASGTPAAARTGLNDETGARNRGTSTRHMEIWDGRADEVWFWLLKG